MKRITHSPLLAALAFCGAFGVGLNGCAPLAAVGTVGSIVDAVAPARAVGDRVELEGTRALVLAHNAYQALAQTAKAAIESDLLTPAQVDRIDALNTRALALLNGADGALSEAERAARVMNVLSDLSGALSVKPRAEATTPAATPEHQH